MCNDKVNKQPVLLERILCAAIKRKEPRPVPCNPYYEGKNDILNIELGYRHHDIMIRFGKKLDKHPDSQGFYTSAGRFVGREEAYHIAQAAGQIINPVPQKGCLFSEDLYYHQKNCYDKKEPYEKSMGT